MTQSTLLQAYIQPRFMVARLSCVMSPKLPEIPQFYGLGSFLQNLNSKVWPQVSDPGRSPASHHRERGSWVYDHSEAEDKVITVTGIVAKE